MRGDDLTTAGQIQQLDREIVRGRAGIHHDPVPLGKQLGNSSLHRPDAITHLRRAAQYGDDGIDFIVAMDCLAIVHAHSFDASRVISALSVASIIGVAVPAT